MWTEMSLPSRSSISTCSWATKSEGGRYPESQSRLNFRTMTFLRLTGMGRGLAGLSHGPFRTALGIVQTSAAKTVQACSQGAQQYGNLGICSQRGFAAKVFR